MFCRRTILDSVIICISSIQMGVKYIYISVFLNKPFQYIGIVNYKTIYKYTCTITVTEKQKWTQD